MEGAQRTQARSLVSYHSRRYNHSLTACFIPYFGIALPGQASTMACHHYYRNNINNNNNNNNAVIEGWSLLSFIISIKYPLKRGPLEAPIAPVACS